MPHFYSYRYTVNLHGPGNETSKVSAQIAPHTTLTDLIRPTVECCLGDHEAGRVLLASTEDEVSLVLRELMFTVVVLVTDFVMVTTKTYSHISEEAVAVAVGDAVPRTFAEVLGVDGDIGSRSADSLTRLVVAEVTDRVNSDCVAAERDSIRNMDGIVRETYEMLRSLSGKPRKPPKQKKKPKVHPWKMENVDLLPAEARFRDSESEKAATYVTKSKSTQTHMRSSRFEKTKKVKASQKRSERKTGLQLNLFLLSICIIDVGNEESSVTEPEALSRRDDASQLSAAEQSTSTRDPDRNVREQECRIYIDTLLGELISSLSSSASMPRSREKYTVLHQRLYQHFWDEAQRKDLNIDPKRFHKLQKEIYKVLLESAARPHAGPSSTSLTQPLLDDLISKVFKEELKTKPGKLKRIVLCLWRIISRLFRSTKVSPI